MTSSLVTSEVVSPINCRVGGGIRLVEILTDHLGQAEIWLMDEDSMVVAYSLREMNLMIVDELIASHHSSS